MHGQHLNPAGRHRYLGRRQTVLHNGRGVQIRQQTGHVRAVALAIPGHHIGEPVEVFGARTGHIMRAGRADLDVDAEDPAHLGHQIGHRVDQETAQSGQFGADAFDPPIALGGIAMRRPRIGQGVGQARRIGVGGRGDDLFGGQRGCPLPVEHHGAVPQRRQVAHAESPTGAGEHLQGGRPGRRVGHQPQSRNHLCHFGNGQQPGKPDHLHRHTANGQRRGDGPGVGVAPHQHRRGGRFLAGIGGCGIAGGDLIGDPVPLGLDVAVQDAADRPDRGAGAGPQRAHRHRTLPRLGRHSVGQVQHAGRIAPAGAQFEGGRRGLVRVGKVGGEAREVGGRGAAPAVDGLDRVPNGGQRQAAVESPAEQLRQGDALGVTGVLILVEQHHAVAAAKLLADLRAGPGQPGRGGHLATEVHDLGLPHPGMQGVDQRHQRGAFGLCLQQVQQPPVGTGAPLARPGRQGVHQPFEFDVGVP